MNNADSTAYLTFSVAVNRGYFNRASGKWVEQTAIFHNVIAHRRLAENAARTLRKGMTVTVTGQFTDASYTPVDSDRLVRRQQLEAADIAISLRYGTAEVTRQNRDSAGSGETTETADAEAVAV